MPNSPHATNVYVPRYVRDKLKELAKKERRTMSVMLEVILEDYIARYYGENKNDNDGKL